jgi:hypothetical protein
VAYVPMSRPVPLPTSKHAGVELITGGGEQPLPAPFRIIVTHNVLTVIQPAEEGVQWPNRGARECARNDAGDRGFRPGSRNPPGASDGGRRRRARGPALHRLLHRKHRNPNTRAAYGVAVRGFFAWLDRHGIGELGAIRTHHVSTYIESLTRSYRAPTVKQHLAAIAHVVRLADRRPSGRETPPPRCAGPSTSSKRARRRSSTAMRPRSSSTASMFRQSSGCATGR